MRAPRFWYAGKPSVASFLLAPLGWLYGAATKRRVAQPAGHKSTVPVICVGNINAGGTGKTPTVIALAQRLAQRGYTPHIVTRGHGGKLTGPVQVDPKTHSADETGDEPLLLAAFAPVWVAKDRVQGAICAEQAGADLILLDDGHQNPSIHKDYSLVVVDAVAGFGNGRVIPAGPLREPVAAGLNRASALLTIGRPTQRDRFQITVPDDVALLEGSLVPLETGMPWQGMRALAFAGIGHPEKFFATLGTLGVDLIRAEALRDHQPLSRSLMLRLQKEAQILNAQLVTTEKDAVRLPAQFRQKVLTLPVRLEITDWTPIDQAFDKLGLTAR